MGHCLVPTTDPTKLPLSKGFYRCQLFGLGIYDDGATIGKNQMMSILAPSAGILNSVIGIIDCSRHMSQGEK